MCCAPAARSLAPRRLLLLVEQDVGRALLDDEPLVGRQAVDLTTPSARSRRARATPAIVTTHDTGGKGRLRRLMNVIASGRVDLRPIVTHHFTLDRVEEAYDLFSHQRDGVPKVAITP